MILQKKKETMEIRLKAMEAKKMIEWRGELAKELRIVQIQLDSMRKIKGLELAQAESIGHNPLPELDTDSISMIIEKDLNTIYEDSMNALH